MTINKLKIVILVLTVLTFPVVAESYIEPIPQEFEIKTERVLKTVKFSKHPFTWVKLRYLKAKGRPVYVEEREQLVPTVSTSIATIPSVELISTSQTVETVEDLKPIQVEKLGVESVDNVPVLKRKSTADKRDQDSDETLVGNFNIIPQQQQMRSIATQAVQDDCGKEVRHAHDALIKNPKDEYLRWRYESWLKRCKKERKMR